MLGARGCLVVVGLLVILAAPVGAVSVQPGWDIIAPTEIVFIGDYVNITVAGPIVNVTVEFRLSDPNGTLFKFFYSQNLNGTAVWNFSTQDEWFPQDGSGVWRVEAQINGYEVAYAEFTVLYDELTYLSRRQALLEEKQAQLEGLNANLNADVKDVHARIDLVLIFVPTWIIMGSIIFYWCARIVGLEWYKILKEIRKQYGPGIKYDVLTQFMNWMFAPYGASELEQFHIEMRQQPEPRWPAAAMAARMTLEAQQHKVPMRRLVPVKKVRVVPKKEA